MADPVYCLQRCSIAVAIWMVLYSVIQLGVMIWQMQVVKEMQWWWENRVMPFDQSVLDGTMARFPGLYQLYTETPERRRVNAMYVIVILILIVTSLNILASVMLLYGAWRLRSGFVWPWFCTGFAEIVLSTAYAVLWWSGDVFTEQLVMSVAEFVVSLALNGICFVLVAFFYGRLVGCIKSSRPLRRKKSSSSYRRRSSSRRRTKRYEDESSSSPSVVAMPEPARPEGPLPAWRDDLEARPIPDAIERRARRDARERYLEDQKRRRWLDEQDKKARRQDPTLPSWRVPERVYSPQFPWTVPKTEVDLTESEAMARQVRSLSPSRAIEQLYYEHYPDDAPRAPPPRPQCRDHPEVGPLHHAIGHELERERFGPSSRPMTRATPSNGYPSRASRRETSSPSRYRIEPAALGLADETRPPTVPPLRIERSSVL